MTRRVETHPTIGRLFRRIGSQVAGLAINQPRYILDANGNCVYMEGPDLSQAPTGCFGSSPSMEATGLSGAGAASKSSGTWVKL